MKFRTEYAPAKSDLRLSPAKPIALAGSCFTDNIASKMRECGWEAFSGAGTLYNPLSIAKVIDLLVFNPDFESELRKSLFRSNDGIVHSWLFDTHFSRLTEEECIEAAAECRAKMLSVLERAQALIVTFGTAWCYFLADSGEVVANCHKMPPATFHRRRISIAEISEVWTDLCERLGERYPDLSIVLTVSPVRHLKDGFEGNARSKATLLLAVDEICGRSERLRYFPAYEILGDDLRDYRFYASDLVHPSDSAVEYIWEIFRHTYIDEAGERLLKEGLKRHKATCHRPIFKA